MSTPLAKQIFVRMKAKNLSIASLEREAGVSAHSVQNILNLTANDFSIPAGQLLTVTSVEQPPQGELNYFFYLF